MEDSHNIFWIASYPKSGNTWMRNILARLLFNATSFAESLHFIQEIYSIQDRQTLWQLPQTEIKGQKVAFLKTHCQFSEIPTECYGIPLKTVGFIYLYRHPLDVLLSAINYWRLEPNAEKFFEDGIIQTPDQLFAAGKIDRYLEKFTQNLSIETWLTMSGRWDDNILSWLNASHSYSLSAILNYNQMIDHPFQELQKIEPIFSSVTTEKLKDALNYAQQVTQYNSNCDHASLESFKKVFFWNGTKDTYKRYFSSSAIQAFYQKNQDLLADLNLI